MERIKQVVLDFDGTLTDTFEEAQPYLEWFPRLFSQRFNIPRIALEAIVARHSTEVGNDPCSGWVHGGKVVAPASVDPYVFTTAVFQRVYKELFGTEGMDAALFDIHCESYKHTLTAFRPGADWLLRKLQEKYDVAIVTNSGTEAVQKKLHQLVEKGCASQLLGLQVVGDAKKYAIDDAWQEVPESIQPVGFPRPVLLRRKKYADVLRRLGSDPARTAVVGDVYELDLALPQFLGYRTIQLRTQGTPQWEIAYSAQRGHIAKEYDDVVAMLR